MMVDTLMRLRCIDFHPFTQVSFQHDVDSSRNSVVIVLTTSSVSFKDKRLLTSGIKMARRKPVGYLPPSSEDATVNEKYTLSNEITPAASTEEKLAWLDQEINLLHTYCTSKGLNPWEVRATLLIIIYSY